jgi:enamine deaminase RidA (YjgF/YER057c/UK114 family)
MSLPSARLAELGLTLPAVPAPVAAYLPAVKSRGLIYTAGQLPFVDGVLPATGKVGAEVSPQQATELARAAALNAIAAAASVVDGVDQLARVVKLTVFVASDPSFTGQPAVANGASELLQQVFGGSGQHARSAVGVAVLPLDAPVELELIVEATSYPV